MAGDLLRTTSVDYAELGRQTVINVLGASDENHTWNSLGSTGRRGFALSNRQKLSGEMDVTGGSDGRALIPPLDSLSSSPA